MRKFIKFLCKFINKCILLFIFVYYFQLGKNNAKLLLVTLISELYFSASKFHMKYIFALYFNLQYKIILFLFFIAL